MLTAFKDWCQTFFFSRCPECKKGKLQEVRNPNKLKLTYVPMALECDHCGKKYNHV